MKRHLTYRLLLYFTGVLLAFALIVSVSYSQLFLGYTESHHLEDMQRLARIIADGIGNRPETAMFVAGQREPPIAARQRRGMGYHHGQRGGQGHSAADGAVGMAPAATDGRYCRRSFHDSDLPSGGSEAGNQEGGRQEIFAGRYLKELNGLSQSEVWIVDANTRSYSLYGEENGVGYDSFPAGAEEMLQKVLQGQTASSRDFTPLLSAPSITVGTPIYGENGAVIGALLLHRTLSKLHDTQKQSMLLFGICLSLALVVAALLAAWLVRRFLCPVQRMESFAKELAAGNYHLRSGIAQEDEIGLLAKSLDALALRLGEARAQKERLDKMRQDFLANISHELRTPITVLRGTLELLSSGLVQKAEKRQEYLRQLTANVLGLERLVQDLFELARLQSTDFALDSSEMNLADALHDAVASAGQMAKPKGISIHMPETVRPLMICGDYGRLRQMFLTVLDNAVKFSPNNGAIEIVVSVEGTAWRIDISDHGCGIPAEALPHIFERFQRSRDGKNAGGTGLGLPIASEIARRHGMGISCRSELGKGTTFTFSGPGNIVARE